MRNRKEGTKATDGSEPPKKKKDLNSAIEMMEQRFAASAGPPKPSPILAAVLIVVPLPFYAAAFFYFNSWALFSQEEVANANVLHPLFKSDKHFHEEFWQPNMTQKERLASMSETLHATSQALEKVNINAFLESSNLIGWQRHDASHIPWDIDGDLGMSLEECKSSKATKATLEAAIGSRFKVIKFACECEEDCDGDNLRMVGRVTSRETGVCVDIFAYAPVPAGKLKDWQLEVRYQGYEWWHRVNDHADYTFPEHSLFPLQDGTFEEQPIRVPNDPSDFLSWEYGKCLGVHVWPWRILLYTPMSFFIVGATAMKCVGLLAGPLDGRAQALALCASVYCFLSMALFKGSGVSVIMLFIVCFGEICVLRWKPNFLEWPARQKHLILTLLIMTTCLYELKGCFEQLYCGIDERFIHPRRPQVWTFCLFGQCWDY